MQKLLLLLTIEQKCFHHLGNFYNLIIQKMLEKVAEYMRAQKLTREYLFEVLDKNCNGNIDLSEF